ncbi:uncharacterized protein LOC126829743 isoform X2 [Patella vulgata]|uniref:uncharacterized protein LOC126829743 isoform X2 n=1 Tax=Patella vulgata TaxID=6465 RepID=UPI002180637C|nr:uncharacterized protein LOC126829743 isoform X2 [Patella vulgata]
MTLFNWLFWVCYGVNLLKVSSDQLLLGVSPDEVRCNYLVLTCLSSPGFRRSDVGIISWFINDSWIGNTKLRSTCITKYKIPNSYECKSKQHAIVIKSVEKEIGTEWKCQEFADSGSFATLRITSESVKTANQAIEPVSNSQIITVNSVEPVQLASEFRLYGHYNNITCFRRLFSSMTTERHAGSTYNITDKVLTVTHDIVEVTEKDGGFYYCKVCSKCICRTSQQIGLIVKPFIDTETTSTSSSSPIVAEESSYDSMGPSTTVIVGTTTSSQNVSEESFNLGPSTTVIVGTTTSSQNVSEESFNLGLLTTVIVGVACGGTAALIVHIIILIVVLVVRQIRRRNQERTMTGTVDRNPPTGSSRPTVYQAASDNQQIPAEGHYDDLVNTDSVEYEEIQLYENTKP